jgi:trypsin
MKLSTVLVAAAVATSATQAADITPLILGGTIVPVGDKTYTTGIRRTATGSDFCGGSLITPTHVLSAGHCYGNAKFVAVGTHFLSGAADGVRIAVKKETRHPSYAASTINWDYNIIELATPVTEYAPVKLLASDPLAFAGTSATVMGWGTTRSGGLQSKELLRVNVTIRTDADCKAANIKGAPISPQMFCAGGVANKDSCQGDSGGPIIIEGGAEGDVLAGVVSWGEGCGIAGKPGVYAKVSSAKDWILSIAPNATFV